MTESEAKTKWCPVFSVLQTTFYIAKPGMTANPEYGKCSGSACMMWKKEGPAVENRCGKSFAPDENPVPPEGEGWELAGEPQLKEVYMPGQEPLRQMRFVPYWTRKISQQGYCGLAGKP